jgi:hypothetical protein
METAKVAEIILDKWRAALKLKDRSKDHVASNFEELFNELREAEVTFDVAREVLPLAVQAHYPPVAIRRRTYEGVKNLVKVSEKEFIESWLKSIKDTATNIFYEVYPPPLSSRVKVNNVAEQKPAMSKKEYQSMRRYADSFPILDTSELEKTLSNNQYNPFNEENDFEDVLGEGDGETN